MKHFEEDTVSMQAKTREMELLKEAHTNLLRTSATTLQEDKDQLMKLYNSFSTSCESLSQEMVEYTELVERILQPTTHDNKSKALALLKSLQNCFTIPDDKLMQAMAKVKQRQLFETQQVHQQIGILLNVMHFYMIIISIFHLTDFQRLFDDEEGRSTEGQVHVIELRQKHTDGPTDT